MGYATSIVFHNLISCSMRLVVLLCLVSVLRVGSQVRLTDIDADLIDIPEPYGQFGVVGYYEVMQTDDKHYSLIVYSSGVLEFRQVDLLNGEIVRSEIPQSCGLISHHYTDSALYACDDLACFRWDYRQNTVEEIFDDISMPISQLWGQGDLIIAKVDNPSAYYIYDQNDNTWTESQLLLDLLWTTLPGFSTDRPLIAIGTDLYNVLTEELVASNWPSEVKRIAASPETDDMIYLTTNREVLAYDLSTFEVALSAALGRIYNIQHHDVTSLYLTSRERPILKVSKETFEVTELPYVPDGVAFNTSGLLMMITDDQYNRFYYNLEDQAILDTADTKADVFYYDEYLVEVNSDSGRVRIIDAQSDVTPIVETLAGLVPPVYGDGEHPLYGLATASTMTPILIGSQGVVELPSYAKYSDVQQQIISVGGRPQFVIGSDYIILDGSGGYEVVDLHDLSINSIVAVLDNYIVQGSGEVLRIYSRAGDRIATTPIQNGRSPKFIGQDMMVPLGTSTLVYLDGIFSSLLVDGEEVVATSERIDYQEADYFVVKTLDAYKLATYDQGAFTSVYDFPQGVEPSLTEMRYSPCGIAGRAGGLAGGATFYFYDPGQYELFETTDLSPHWEGSCFFYQDDLIASYKIGAPTDLDVHYDRSVIPAGVIVQSVTSDRILYTSNRDGLYVYDGDYTLISDEVDGGVTYTGSGSYRMYALEDKVVAQLYEYGCHNSTILVSDGTQAGTRRFDGEFAIGQHAIFLDTVAYFTAFSAGHGAEVWRTDGTVDGTGPLRDITGDALSSLPKIYACDDVSERVYFHATTAEHRQQIWYLDKDTGVLSSLDNSPTVASTSINVVPNPASDFMTIEAWPDGAYAMFFDGVGNLMIKTVRATIDVSSWPPGVYSVVVVSFDNMSTTRFVVAH